MNRIHMIPGSNISSRIDDLETGRPVAEVLVEGELSPFEHEALYQLLKKHFRLEQPSYSDLLDEIIGTRVNIVFHHPYDRKFFTDILRDDWRGLKELFKQIRYRRGRLGAAFNLTFIDQKVRLVFSLGLLGEEELGSAMNQIAHLTGIVAQMMRPETMVEALERVETSYDGKTDRWQNFRGVGLTDKKEYVFHESLFRWKTRSDM
ncbi:hypothetical protein E6H14_00055 [Candidatus Bathyarchaeota archaeon]|nr:MAG: hypothetical protein E6H14_00055 [Candidatus Bathyarchaeota archaeon]